MTSPGFSIIVPLFPAALNIPVIERGSTGPGVVLDGVADLVLLMVLLGVRETVLLGVADVVIDSVLLGVADTVLLAVRETVLLGV